MSFSFVKKHITDCDIRRAIRVTLIPDIVGDSGGRIVEEMTICSGGARVDLAVINGNLHGFEIKSEADTLVRLAGQITAYNQVFDTMTIICGAKHLDAITTIIPEWWGIYSVKYNLCAVELTKVRCAEMNQEVCGLALAQLLWKSELAALLNEAGLKKGISSKPCRELWQIVSNTFSTDALRDKVREILKFRADWRVAPQPA
jgi:hypothetical protein